jgi:hypothetical protein
MQQDKPLTERPVLRVKNRGGAPKGNRNAWKTGAHAAPVRDWLARARAWRRRVEGTLATIDAEWTQRRQ